MHIHRPMPRLRKKLDTMTPGQIAYEAWMKWITGGQLGDGPNWPYLSERERQAWETAARAVLDRGFELREEAR